MEDNGGGNSGLLFIDVDENPTIPEIKEERASSPDEKLSELKKKNKEKVKLHCSECNYSTDSAERMTRHIRKAHRGENPFQCTLCEYSTYNGTLFTEHVNIHKGYKPYKCTHCPYRTVSKKYIKMHELKHGICDKCGYVARNRPEYRRHRREAGCGAAEDSTRNFHCATCNLSYHTIRALDLHKRNHKECNICGKAFSHSILVSHLVVEHGVKTEKKKFKFYCKVCKWNSNCPQKILLHIIHHPNQALDDSIDVTPLVKTGILPAKINKVES